MNGSMRISTGCNTYTRHTLGAHTCMHVYNVCMYVSIFPQGASQSLTYHAHGSVRSTVPVHTRLFFWTNPTHSPDGIAGLVSYIIDCPSTLSALVPGDIL